MTRSKTALVLGATGGIGGAVTRRLLAGGWSVRALHRKAGARAARPVQPELTWVAGDAMRAADVVAAAHGASLIVHAVNPPGYRNWGELVLPMLESTLAAAHASGARILLPGTVYNFGPDVFPVIAENAPQNPATRKGALRAEMERRLQRAAGKGVRTLIVRAGDFFGPQAGNSWFSQGVVKPGVPVAAVTQPGLPGVGHQWAYLPDAAEIMARLAEREGDLEPFAAFHMEGHWDPDGMQLIAAIRRVVGRPDLKVRGFPWWLVSAASPVVPLFRELREMRYLWQEPLRLDNRRLLGVLGTEPRTPLDEAVRATLISLGCLPGRGGPAAAVPSFTAAAELPR